MFEPGLENDESFPASGNLFTVGNRFGYFACGCQNGRVPISYRLMVGLLFDKTGLLRDAFDAAKPKAIATLGDIHKISLNGTPTHVRFTADEKFLIVAISGQGVTIFDCNRLREKV
jgi:hypothetical protein